jgi:hypothetical protein
MKTPLVQNDLPESASDLLKRVSAPPRLVAHLTLVHDVACRITGKLSTEFPEFHFNPKFVTFGAATHDIGKSVFREELSVTGQKHEREGEKLLLNLGVPPELARFARTHGEWRLDSNPSVEDLLVALADSVWKGKRDETLEARLIPDISIQTGLESWAVFESLDNFLSEIAFDADHRIDWQKSFPVS